MASKTGKQVTLNFAMTNDGQIAFFAADGTTSEDGKRAIELLMEALQTKEINLKNISPVEKHRDDPKIQVVHDLTHDHNHRH